MARVRDSTAKRRGSAAASAGGLAAGSATRSAGRRARSARPVATFEIEAAEARHTKGLVAGVDEAGRGPWAGPVVAAAVILDPARIPEGLADSKTLTSCRREALLGELVACARIGVGIADVARIDRDNILAATMWAMAEAVAALGDERPAVALVDGNRAPALACPARTVVNGDALCVSIAAASIVAKVTRDRIMTELGSAFPQYGFERHKGYGTEDHRDALARHGVTIHHRRSFAPVRLALSLSQGA